MVEKKTLFFLQPSTLLSWGLRPFRPLRAPCSNWPAVEHILFSCLLLTELYFCSLPSRSLKLRGGGKWNWGKFKCKTVGDKEENWWSSILFSKCFALLFFLNKNFTFYCFIFYQQYLFFIDFNIIVFKLKIICMKITKGN